MSVLGSGEIAARVAAVRERVGRACARVGRDPAEVRLIAASKTFGPEAVVEALAAGVTDFGENRVQEALGKQAAVAELAAVRGLSAPTWHLVGHLQSNKARAAVGAFAILHGIDSVRLLDVLDRWAPGRPVRVLLEVNVAGEPTKFGLAPSELPAAVARARGLVGVELVGLMTVAPRVADPEEVRPVFRRLAALARDHGLRELSMGMTDDFEVAIEEGASMVRVGRAIFGGRR
ncbi:YggS family pyridoxal phosphate-dependent enzyme [Tepidiforma sp.]|uniref:YggS family pyridoxal phosphate-dependent enzyme n=1 Tax=Tepidiforma sp. TaxID=2682230 RepID=UPI002ADE1A2B|nr:YggS family pyridoxal phosphate-dependent enzyme [Tepidiforma sp.]